MGPRVGTGPGSTPGRPPMSFIATTELTTLETELADHMARQARLSTSIKMALERAAAIAAEMDPNGSQSNTDQTTDHIFGRLL